MGTTHDRVLRALARQGLDVRRDGALVRVRQTGGDRDAEVLLPEDFPLEAKALRQLAQLAAVRHPEVDAGVHVCATPDFHPGDAGIPIGSVVVSDGIAIPAAVGRDINCGMRLHATDLDRHTFEAGREELVRRLKGDYLLGTRDVGLSRLALQALFASGVPGWSDAMRRDPLGMATAIDFDQVDAELGRTDHDGGFDCTDLDHVPDELLRNEVVRPDDLGTIGRGNHFVEIQVVEKVLDRHWAWAWLGSDAKPGRVVCMIHSGSRQVGKAIGSLWLDRVRRAWPRGERFPDSKIFPLRTDTDLFSSYLQAQAAAANYGFVNRVLLGELWRRRMREVFGPRALPLVWDQPHNLMSRESVRGEDRWVTRKGACPAHEGRPTIVPGSMGTASYLCVGLGNERFASSASHGAGRAASRIRMGRTITDAAHRTALGLDGVHCVTLREERLVQEAPAAYKPIDPVIDVQVAAGVLAPVLELRPLLTFKA